MRIYLDMCCYNRPYDEQSQLKIAMETQSKLYIQRLIQNGKIELIGSYILDYECSKIPNSMRKNTIISFIYKYMTAYVGIERDELISKKAMEIMKSGVKEKDAFHVASAIYADCEYFISTDIRLLKYKTNEIKMLNPIEFVIKMEEE